MLIGPSELLALMSAVGTGAMVAVAVLLVRLQPVVWLQAWVWAAML